jgi:uncharacterized protein YdhG (YjbR/CyaY superfamily)
MTPENYIKEQPEVCQTHLRDLRGLILKAAPDADELINYGTLAFALVPGGKRDQQLMIAGYKKHVGFYPHPSTMERFWDQLHEYKKAKGSVQFPLDKPLPKDLILEMVSFRRNMIRPDK